MKYFTRKKWRRRDQILLLERLELYIGAGMGVDTALELCGEGVPAWQKSAITAMHTHVQSGGFLSRVLVDKIGISSTLGSLIEHGESAGAQAIAISKAKILLEREDELIKKCLSALAYPAIIGLCATLLTIGLVKGIMPQIIPLLLGLHVPLPLLTRVVIWISGHLLSYGLPILAGIVFFAWLTRYTYRKYERARMFIQRLALLVPFVGGLIQTYVQAAFLQSLGSLVESGLDVSVSFRKAGSTVGLISLQKKFTSSTHDLNHGISLGSILSRVKSLPSYVVPLVRSGEMSGTLGVSLARAASIMDRDIEHSLKRVVALVEPLMMVGMGGSVGAIALAIMMPIYDISRVLQH